MMHLNEIATSGFNSNHFIRYAIVINPRGILVASESETSLALIHLHFLLNALIN